MVKTKRNTFLVISLLLAILAIGSIFAIVGKNLRPTQIVQAAETRAPGLYQTGTTDFVVDSSSHKELTWQELIDSKKITITTTETRKSLEVTDKTLAGDLICDNVPGLTSLLLAFSNCNKLTAIDVSRLDTKNVTDMREVFSGCSSITALDLSNFNTSSATDMSRIFVNCSSITALDLGNFNTKKAKNISEMFSGCFSLRSLDLSSFDTSSVTNMQAMFSGCTFTKLVFGEKFVVNENCEQTGIFDNYVEIFSDMFTPEQIAEIIALGEPAARVEKFCEFIGNEETTVENLKKGGGYEYYLALFTDANFNTIIAPQIDGNIKISLYPYANYFYALADDPAKTEVTKLSSATNGKTLKLYNRATNAEVPPVHGSGETPSTGIRADVLTIVVAFTSIVSLAIVATRKKRIKR